MIRTGLVFFILLLFHPIFSQSKLDSLNNAKQLLSEMKFSAAEELLIQFLKNNNDNLEANWLLALTYQYEKKVKLASISYKRALILSPNDLNLLMDYAKFLYSINDMRGFESMTASLINDPNFRLETLKMKANLEFWNEDYVEALNTIKAIELIDSQDVFVSDLIAKIKTEQKLRLSLGVDYFTDNQPLGELNEKILIAKKFSKWINPMIEIFNANYSISSTSKSFIIGNTFNLTNLGLKLYTRIGLFNLSSFENRWIYDIQIDKKVAKNLSFNFGFNQKPYLSTLSSLGLDIMQQNYHANLKYSNDKLLDFNVLYNHQLFEDNNWVNSFGFWVLSKKYGFKNLNIRLGYGFAYSDSKKNMFTSLYSVDLMLNNSSLINPISGIYEPYFTPKRQLVNSAVFVINYDISSKFKTGLTMNLGLLSSHLNPYLYLDSNNLGVIHLVKKYSRTAYFPAEIKANMSYDISKKMRFNFYYNYQQTFYYSRQNIGLELNYKI